MKIRIRKISFIPTSSALAKVGIQHNQEGCQISFFSNYTDATHAWPSTCNLLRTQSWHTKQATNSQKVLPRTQLRIQTNLGIQTKQFNVQISQILLHIFWNLIPNLQLVILPIFQCSSSLRATKAHNCALIQITFKKIRTSHTT